MEEKQQINFSEYEKEEIENIQNNKGALNKDWFLKRWLKTFLTKCIINLTTKKSWQISFIIYLLIVIPVGTYCSIKKLILLLFF